FADLSVPTHNERNAFDGQIVEADAATTILGPSRRIWVCAHGSVSTVLGGALRTSDGERVLDAADLLHADLTGSTLILEACWAGRNFGHPFGEAHSLGTAALIAGAAEVIAGLFPLPISPLSTGQLIASVHTALQGGLTAGTALRV